MITYTDDFSGVKYTDPATGKDVIVLDTDGPRFNDLVAIMDKQTAAASKNTANVTTYNTIITGDQISENASRPYPPAPPIPQKIVIDDNGKETRVDFPAGTLAVLTLKGATNPSQGSGTATTGIPADRLDQVLAKVTTQGAKLDALMAMAKREGWV